MATSRKADKPAAVQDRFASELAARGAQHSFRRGELLIREGERDDTLFLIVEGRVRVFSTENGKEVVIDEHGPGRFIGEMALDGDLRSASVQAIEPVLAVAIPRLAVLDYLGMHPDFALTLIMTLIRRARLATENLKNIALRDVYGRIAALLQSLAEEQGGRMVVRGKLTQLEIAQRVGASREMVSLILRDLAEGGYVVRERDGLVIKRPLPERW